MRIIAFSGRRSISDRINKRNDEIIPRRCFQNEPASRENWNDSHNQFKVAASRETSLNTSRNGRTTSAWIYLCAHAKRPLRRYRHVCRTNGGYGRAGLVDRVSCSFIAAGGRAVSDRRPFSAGENTCDTMTCRRYFCFPQTNVRVAHAVADKYGLRACCPEGHGVVALPSVKTDRLPRGSVSSAAKNPCRRPPRFQTRRGLNANVRRVI